MLALLYNGGIIMKMVYNGIYRNVEEKDVKKYLDMGWKSKGCIEPQPEQNDLYVIDDYTIGRLDNKESAK